MKQVATNNSITLSPFFSYDAALCLELICQFPEGILEMSIHEASKYSHKNSPLKVLIFNYCRQKTNTSIKRDMENGRKTKSSRKYSENAEWQRVNETLDIILYRDGVGGQTHYKGAEISHTIMPEIKVIKALR